MNGKNRQHPFMVTYSGRKVLPLQMKVEDIHILDIAHALSNMCRYNGHVSTFYSVAEHCALLADSKFPGDPRWKLMHDASEAYMPDVVYPLKELIPGFVEAEDKLLDVIAEAFELPPYTGEVKEQVKIGDKAILYWEGKLLMARASGTCWTDGPEPEVKVTVLGLSPREAEIYFVKMFRRLFRRLFKKKGAPADGKSKDT